MLARRASRTTARRSHGRRETLRESLAGIVHGDAHAVGRATVRHESRGLFVLRADRRAVGRALPHPRLRLRSRGARQLPAHSGADADRGIAALGPDGPAVRAATSFQCCWAPAPRPRPRLPRRGRNACRRPRWSPGSPPSGSSAPSGRCCLRTARRCFRRIWSAAGSRVLNMATMGGTFLAQTISGFVIGLFPTGPDGAYALDAYRLVFGLQAAFIAIGLIGLFRRPRPPPQDRRRQPCADRIEIGQPH